MESNGRPGSGFQGSALPVGKFGNPKFLRKKIRNKSKVRNLKLRKQKEAGQNRGKTGTQKSRSDEKRLAQ
jgi:hypothetical protein